MNILVNLPPTFFNHPSLSAIFKRIDALGEVRKTSHNSADELRADLGWADAVIMWSWPTFTDDLLSSAPNLRYSGNIDITQPGARVALARKLPVSISRRGFSPAVSEMALSLILSLLRRTSDYHSDMRSGDEKWVANFPGDIDVRERELTGRSVGIVGFGNVGRRLAELLVPFHCPLQVYDPFVPEDALRSFDAKKAELDTLLQSSEVVVLCAASNSGTSRLIGQKQMETLRPGAVFINVARAALVDMDALTQRLERGDISAAIDVFDHEPLPLDAPIRSLPNAYLTPHRGGGLIVSVQRILSALIDDLEAELAGQPRKYPLTEQMLSSLDA